MDEALLDTDILSVIFKAKNPQVLNVGRQYLAQHQRFAFSAITLYEVIRGLRATGLLASWLNFSNSPTTATCFRFPSRCSCAPPICGRKLVNEAFRATTPT
jgi:hypothetical protein